MYPALEIVHILGIVVLVGSAFLFDLRLLGLSTNLPLVRLSEFLLSWSRRGLILVVPSGLLLFITNARTLGLDPTFWLKIVLLIVTGLNALVFHRLFFKGKIEPGESPQLPLQSKVHALASILLWIAVITCGRLLAY
ncbi:DUF6644 family protein [Algoriphagus jejuensis]